MNLVLPYSFLELSCKALLLVYYLEISSTRDEDNSNLLLAVYAYILSKSPTIIFIACPFFSIISLCLMYLQEEPQKKPTRPNEPWE